MIRTPVRFTIRALLSVLIFTVAIAAMGAVVPAGAGAFAAIEGPPSFSSAPGLPDGRVYEQVSPANKNGNEAGADTESALVGVRNHYGYVSPDGDAVLFEGTGPMGESPWGDSELFVAKKNSGASGWSTRALTPREPANVTIFSSHGLIYVDPSQDLSHALLASPRSGFGSRASEGCEGSIFLAGSDPLVAATWVERPSSELASPVEGCGGIGEAGAPVGGTPDFSTVYFTFPGTLLPEDTSRAVYAGEAWGLYEYTGGVLHEAGVLPDRALSPFGAVPAASGHGRNITGNQVSEDGSRLFFVSPDPASCTENGGRNDCATEPPELYLRESGERTVLVSRDALLGEPAGVPVAAPGGVLRMPNPSRQFDVVVGGAKSGSFVFASPDGSQAFFQSTEALTRVAAEDSPGAEPKTYDFDVATGSVTFLPGVRGEILATDADGSGMAFLSPEAGGQPARLSLWNAGAAGGTVTQVVELPAAGSVSETRISADGSVLVFQTSARLSGSFNSGGYEQIYRYDVPANTLGCVSCDPAGLTPRGNAELSILFSDEERGGQNSAYESSPSFLDQRGISSGGDRIFFDSPDPLVPQDVNTNSPEVLVTETYLEPQGRDVYEWENGVVYLISTGQSSRDSYLLGSSENGDDVFFATTQGLVPADTDGGYDVYDARVPHEGEPLPPTAVPCEGAVCQGPPNVPAPLTPPGSATFSGLDNPTPETIPLSAKTITKTVKCVKGRKLSRGKCVKVKSKKKSVDRASHNGRAR